MKVYRCVRCNAVVERRWVETTTLSGNQSWVPGLFDPCGACGCTARPVEYGNTPAIGPIHDQPAIPTPEEMLRAAGTYEVENLRDRWDLPWDQWW